MGARRWLPVLAGLAIVAPATGVLAQPPAANKHAPATAAARPSATPHPAATTRPGSPAAIAYMSGKQALVGWHAPSEKPIAHDPAGRAMLTLTRLSRGESLSIPAASDDGGFASTDLDRAAHLLRAAMGDEHPVDPRTLALAYRIQLHFGVPELLVVSGYRVPKPGSRSNHGKGRALDLVVPGVADEEVARFTRDMGFAGVGVYPSSQFVHVDIRPRSYFWVDYSGPRMKNRERGILGDVAARSDAAAVARGQAPVEPFGVVTDVDGALRARGVPSASVALPAEEDDDEEN